MDALIKIDRWLIFSAQCCALAFLAYSLPCHAVCSISSPAMLSLGSVTLSSQNAIRMGAGGGKFQYVFLIKCTTTSNYKLVVADQDAAQSPGILTLNNEKGDQISVKVTLKSVGGNPINTEFNALPGGFYNGSLSAEQSQQVIVDLVPVGIKPKSVRALPGSYKGSGLLNLIY